MQAKRKEEYVCALSEQTYIACYGNHITRGSFVSFHFNLPFSICRTIDHEPAVVRSLNIYIQVGSHPFFLHKLYSNLAADICWFELSPICYLDFGVDSKFNCHLTTPAVAREPVYEWQLELGTAKSNLTESSIHFVTPF